MTAIGDTMRYRNPLDGLLFSTTATRVMRALMRFGTPPRTGRHIARLARTPPHRTSEVLARLQREGMVRSTVAGRAYMWSLNENHALVSAFRDLFDAETTALSRQKARLRRALVQAGGVRKAVVFGSAARGEERPGSDLDLLVVAENRKALKRIEENLERLRGEFWQDGGPRLSPLLYTAREFERKRGLPVIQAAEREGEVLVGEGER